MRSASDFRAEFWRIAVPVTAQSVIMALVLVTDQLMVGQLGSVAVASVGISSKVTAVLTVALTGLGTGLSVLAAQFWGQADRDRIRHLLGFGLGVGLVVATAITLLVTLAPGWCMAPFTSDPGVVTDGSTFVRVIALGYVPMMLTLIYSALLRSTGRPQLPLVASSAAAVLNLLLDWLLIFGHWGCPALGLVGAAISTTIARVCEITIILGGVYAMRDAGRDASRDVCAVTRLADLRGATPALRRTFAAVALPLAVNELVWILGESAYVVVYGRMGTDSLAAMTMTFPMQSLAIAVMTGIASAASVLVGHRLGRGDRDDARVRARQLITAGVAAALGAGGLIVLLAPVYVGLYDVSGEVQHLGWLCLLVFAGFLWVKVANMVLAGAVLQAGGDSRFVLLMESLATWCLGVPLAVAAAFLLDLPVWATYAVLSVEEVARLAVGTVRLRSGRWLRTLTIEASQPDPAPTIGA